VACGDIDADGMAEIITAPGPGPSFPSHIRAFNYDGSAVSPIDEINFFVFGTGYGGRVGSGDMDGDGTDDILVAPGPQPGIGTIAVSIIMNPDGQGELLYAFEAFPNMDAGGNLAAGRFPLDGRGRYATERSLGSQDADPKGEAMPEIRLSAAEVTPRVVKQ